MSTTVHLSNVPTFCQEQDVYRALLAFGSATEVQINRQNNCAAVTMRTPHEAQALRNQHTVNIMGSMVNVISAGAVPPQAPAAPQQPAYGGYPSAGALPPHQGSLMGAMRPRLRFVVENCTYPVTRPLLLQLFNMVAQPTHVFCGPPGATTSGDVEFQDQATTDRVLQELNNKFIYPDCCLMRLYYEQPQQQQQPQQPRMPMQPPMGMSMQQQQQQQQPLQQSPQQPMQHQQQMAPPHMNQAPYGNYDPSMGNGNMQPQQHHQQQHQAMQPMGQQQQQQPMSLPQQNSMGYGGQPPYMYDGNNNSQAPGSLSNINTNNNGGLNNNQMDMRQYDGSGMGMGPNGGPNMMMGGPGPNNFRGGRGGVGRGGPAGMMMMRGGRGGVGGRGDGMMFDPMAGPGYGHGAGNFARGGGPGDVAPPVQQDGTVMIANVSEAVALYDLWVLLEVYGNVNSLKRMFKDKTSVVAQFQHAVDARNAVFNLHSCRFRGHALSLKHFAGYVERGRVEWNLGPATDPSTQAVLFTSGYHHRTKPNAPFNAQGRVHPEKYLYISNLTADISDATVKELLSSTKEAGQPRREVVKFYRKNDMSAIAEFADVETSVDALIVSHAHQIKDRYLRVTFSRHPTEPRPEPRPQPEKGENEEATSGEPTKTEPTKTEPTPAAQTVEDKPPAETAEEKA